MRKRGALPPAENDKCSVGTGTREQATLVFVSDGFLLSDLVLILQCKFTAASLQINMRSKWWVTSAAWSQASAIVTGWKNKAQKKIWNSMKNGTPPTLSQSRTKPGNLLVHIYEQLIRVLRPVRMEARGKKSGYYFRQAYTNLATISMNAALIHAWRVALDFRPCRAAIAFMTTFYCSVLLQIDLWTHHRQCALFTFSQSDRLINLQISPRRRVAHLFYSVLLVLCVLSDWPRQPQARSF
jgi:hypothetical protein